MNGPTRFVQGGWCPHVWRIVRVGELVGGVLAQVPFRLCTLCKRVEVQR